MHVTRRLILASAAALVSLCGPGAGAGDPVVVRAGNIPVLGAAQLFVIDQLGWDKENGFDLQFKQFDSGPNMIQALASGTLDAYVAGVGPVIVAKSQGIGVRVVAATAVEELVVAASPELGALPGSPAEAISALAKKLGRKVKIGTQPAGSVPNTMLQYWLWERIKADKDAVELVPMGIDATQQALLAGALDAAIIREPALTIITDREPKTKVLAYGGDILENQPGNVLALTDDFIKAHPDIAQKLVDLTVKATLLIQTDPKIAASVAEKVLGKGLVSSEVMLRALQSKAVKFNVDPLAIYKQTVIFRDFQVKIGVLKQALPLEGIFDATFYDKASKGKK